MHTTSHRVSNVAWHRGTHRGPPARSPARGCAGTDAREHRAAGASQDLGFTKTGSRAIPGARRAGMAAPKAPRHPRGRRPGPRARSSSPVPAAAPSQDAPRDDDHGRASVSPGQWHCWGPVVQAIAAFSRRVHTLHREARSLLLCKLAEQ